MENRVRAALTLRVHAGLDSAYALSQKDFVCETRMLREAVRSCGPARKPNPENTKEVLEPRRNELRPSIAFQFSDDSGLIQSRQFRTG